MSAHHDYLLLDNMLIVSALLFVLGGVGLVSRRNMVAMLLAAGLMLQGATMMFVAFGRFHGSSLGEIAGVFVLTATVAAAAVSVGVVRRCVAQTGSVDASMWNRFRDPQYDLLETGRQSVAEKRSAGGDGSHPSPVNASPDALASSATKHG